MRSSSSAVLAFVVFALVASPFIATAEADQQRVEWEMTGLFSGNVIIARDGSLRVVEYNSGDPVSMLNPELRCFDTFGHALWTYRITGHCMGGVVGVDGTTYLSTSNSPSGPSVLALDNNGTVKWIFNAQNLTGGTPSGVSTPMIAKDGTVLFMVHGSAWPLQDEPEENSWLFDLDADGSLTWMTEFNDSHVRAFGILESSGAILVAPNQYGITALGSNGTAKWELDLNITGYKIAFGPVVQNDIIFMGVRNISRNVPCELWSFNENGSFLWRYAFNGEVPFMQGGDISSVVADTNGTVYAVTQPGQEVSSALWEDLGANTTYGRMVPGKLISLTPEGDLRWSKDVDSASSEIILDSNGLIYLNTGSEILAFENDGSITERYRAAQGTMLRSLALSNGGIFVLSKIGTSGYTTISVSSGMPHDNIPDFLQKNTILIVTMLILISIFVFLTYVRLSTGKRKQGPR